MKYQVSYFSVSAKLVKNALRSSPFKKVQNAAQYSPLNSSKSKTSSKSKKSKVEPLSQDATGEEDVNDVVYPMSSVAQHELKVGSSNKAVLTPQNTTVSVEEDESPAALSPNSLNINFGSHELDFLELESTSKTKLCKTEKETESKSKKKKQKQKSDSVDSKNPPKSSKKVAKDKTDSVVLLDFEDPTEAVVSSPKKQSRSTRVNSESSEDEQHKPKARSKTKTKKSDEKKPKQNVESSSKGRKKKKVLVSSSDSSDAQKPNTVAANQETALSHQNDGYESL